ncbi:ATF/CREB activator [Cymbomonas tetramitiformis]|uniref:Calcium-transporting ATPase n=1 Tax=Cymbomonas tetramitiformis TaxID=36881 RepID=A0AAE0F3P4_9CHLO|nr:ATF/CREB activator [Cymbomonas tetramitiformis]
MEVEGGGEGGIAPRRSPAQSSWRKAVLTINGVRRFRYHGYQPGSESGRPSLSRTSTNSSMQTAAPSIADDVAAKRWRVAGTAVKLSNHFKAHQGAEKGSPSALLQQTKAKESEPVVEGPNGFGITSQELVELTAIPQDPGNLAALGGVERLAKMLKVDITTGIDGKSPAEIEARKAAFGENTYPEQPPKAFWEYCWEACQDLTLMILVLCAIAALGCGIAIEGAEEGWYDGAGIFFAIVLVVLVTAINDYQQDLQFRDLDAKNKEMSKVSVIRNGNEAEIQPAEAVVGDIVKLKTGCELHADGVVISVDSLTVDESAMTGESDLIRKDALSQPYYLSGTKVEEGYGLMLVTAVGVNTEWGKLMAMGKDPDEVERKMQILEEQFENKQVSEEDYKQSLEALETELEESNETPLQVRLNGLATNIGKLGCVVAFVVLVVLVVRFCFDKDWDEGSTSEDANHMVEYFAIAVTIIVVAVPEGLPLAVTLSLAYSMQKMMQDNSLVRHLKACETMGGATNICSDKTGTLTTNSMTVVKSSLMGINRTEENKDAKSTPGLLPPNGLSLLYEAIFANAEGGVSKEDKHGNPLPEPLPFTGSPTEKALLSYGREVGGSYEVDKSGVVCLKGVVAKIRSPFSSKKKRMGCLIVDQSDGSKRIHWKGASEIILSLCTQKMGETGKVEDLSDDERKALEAKITGMATQSLRTLCFGYCDVPADFKEPEGDEELPAVGLTFIGLVGIKDPPRPGVPEAVIRCQKAGVQVRMVTGDNVVTARAIAKEVNILTDDGLAVEGKEFRLMSYSERLLKFGPRLEKLQVMARSSPSDKYDLVHMLRGLGEVVGVTGDGTNDAKALKEADVGLAMGIAGTEVAKRASDIIILDDNFASIVTVVRWGRSVYCNIQKFVQFQLTVNLVALALNFISAVAIGTAPLTAVQLLWVNLIMDTMGALALGTEPPSEELMKQKPYGRTTPLITNVMWRNILGQTVFQLILLLVYTFSGYSIFNITEITGECKDSNDEVFKQYEQKDDCPYDWHSFDVHEQKEEENTLIMNTIIFNTFVFCQVFNEINARHMTKVNVLEGLHKNLTFCGIILITCFCQVLLVETPLSTFASTHSLTAMQWVWCVLVGSVSIPLAMLVKQIPVTEGDPFKEFEEKLKGGNKQSQLLKVQVCVADDLFRPLMWGSQYCMLF